MMQLDCLLLAVLGFLSGMAAANQCTGNKNNKGYCEVVTYEDRTTNNKDPPSNSQCESTCQGILEDAGDWSVSFVGKPAGFVQHVVISACDFSVGRVRYHMCCMHKIP